MTIYQNNVREVFYNRDLYSYEVGQGYPLESLATFSNCIVYSNKTLDRWYKPKKGSVTYLPFLVHGVKVRVRTCTYNKYKYY